MNTGYRFASLALFFFHATSHGATVAATSLREKVSEASVVVIASAEDASYMASGLAANERAALIRVVDVLQGSTQPREVFVYQNGIAELAVRCIETGGRYLIFATRDKRGFLAPVSGNDDSYRLDAPAADRCHHR
jgi:hypothetical protein